MDANRRSLAVPAALTTAAVAIGAAGVVASHLDGGVVASVGVFVAVVAVLTVVFLVGAELLAMIDG